MTSQPPTREESRWRSRSTLGRRRLCSTHRRCLSRHEALVVGRPFEPVQRAWQWKPRPSTRAGLRALEILPEFALLSDGRGPPRTDAGLPVGVPADPAWQLRAGPLPQRCNGRWHHSGSGSGRSRGCLPCLGVPARAAARCRPHNTAESLRSRSQAR